MTEFITNPWVIGLLYAVGMLLWIKGIAPVTAERAWKYEYNSNEWYRKRVASYSSSDIYPNVDEESTRAADQAKHRTLVRVSLMAPLWPIALVWWTNKNYFWDELLWSWARFLLYGVWLPVTVLLLYLQFGIWPPLILVVYIAGAFTYIKYFAYRAAKNRLEHEFGQTLLAVLAGPNEPEAHVMLDEYAVEVNGEIRRLGSEEIEDVEFKLEGVLRSYTNTEMSQANIWPILLFGYLLRQAYSRGMRLIRN